MQRLSHECNTGHAHHRAHPLRTCIRDRDTVFWLSSGKVGTQRQLVPEMTVNSSDFEALLQETGWMHKLARALARDAQAADDLVQDAWVAALEERACVVRSQKGWFGGVLRHMSLQHHRSSTRRVRREQVAVAEQVAQDSAPRSVADSVAMHRDVADALLSVAEPLRTALYLRFFRGMSLAAIGRREGMPTSTVHDRLGRGIEAMRTRLDAAGEPLRVLESFGVFSAFGKEAKIDAGKSGVLQVFETGRTVVLYRGDEELARQLISLDSAHRLEVKF